MLFPELQEFSGPFGGVDSESGEFWPSIFAVGFFNQAPSRESRCVGMAKTKKIFAIVVLFLMGPAFIWWGTVELLNSRKLKDHGKTVMGVATEKISYRRRFSTTYYVKVQFQTESGQTFTERFDVSEKEYDRVESDPAMKVHYLPEDPKVCVAGETVQLKFWNIVWGLGFLASAIYLVLYFKQPIDEHEAAEQVASEFGKLCVGQYEYAPADARKFGHLDLAWLNRAQENLDNLGFPFLQDTENLTLSRGSSGPKTFLRMHLGRQGTAMAALYHFKPGLLLRLIGAKQARVCDVETEFSNGQWVCTGNAEAAGALQSPPGVDTLQLPASTPIDAVVQAHDTRVKKFMAQNPAAQCKRMSGIEDILRAQNRLQEIKAAFRRGHGISKAELEKIAGMKDPNLDLIQAEAQRLHKQQQSRAA
jgi:hypothetical protein